MQSLIKFDDFIKELNQNNSRNYKMEVLRKYADDEDVKYYLNFLFNPYITTGIGKKSYQRFHNDSCIDVYPENIFKTTKEALEYLKVHNTSDYETQEYMFSFFMYLMMKEIITKDEKGNLSTPPEEERRYIYELFYKIITKNLPLGIDVLTINKCIPNLIPTFNVMLANKYFEKPEYVEGKRFALTTKIDGGRIIAIKKNGEARFYTRQGQEYEGLVDLKEEMEKLLPDNLCLDGEITLLNPYVVEKDEEGRPAIGRKLSSKEQYKETMKITRKDGEKHGVKMRVFDCMTAEEFENQKCNNPYFARRADLLNYFSKSYMDECLNWDKEFAKVNLKNYPYCPTDPIESEEFNQKWKADLLEFLNTKYTYFSLLPLLYVGEDTSKILEILDEQIAQGEEGIMINIWDAPYQFRRNNDLLKVKKMNDIDLPILDFEEGTNKHKGKLGAIITEYKGFPLKVGSGFTDELREKIWNNKEDYRGLTMSVQYFEETTNQEGGISLRFPVFLDFRYDK